MKSIKSLTLLLGASIFLNLGSTALSAQDMKNAIAVKIPKAKLEAMKSDSEKSVDARLKPNTFNNLEWTRKNDNQDYQRGKIRTH